MPNNLPNPITAGSVVITRESLKDGRFRFDEHQISAPLHILTPEMVEAVRDEVAFCLRIGMVGEHVDIINRLRSAFAPILNPPKPEPEKSCREKIEQMGKCDTTWGGQAVAIMADAVDRLMERIEKLEGK